ncbi:MAG: hypothetical protein ABSH04_03795 [Acidimicrobiales bacterium]
MVAVEGDTVTLSWTNPPGTLGDDVFSDGTKTAWPGWPNPVVDSYQETNVATGSHTYSVAAYNSGGVGPNSGAATVVVTTTNGGGRHSGVIELVHE